MQEEQARKDFSKVFACKGGSVSSFFNKRSLAKPNPAKQACAEQLRKTNKLLLVSFPTFGHISSLKHQSPSSKSLCLAVSDSDSDEILAGIECNQNRFAE